MTPTSASSASSAYSAASFRVAAGLALLFVVPVAAPDASPFRDLDRYAFGYAYPGSQLKDPYGTWRKLSDDLEWRP